MLYIADNRPVFILEAEVVKVKRNEKKKNPKTLKNSTDFQEHKVNNQLLLYIK